MNAKRTTIAVAAAAITGLMVWNVANPSREDGANSLENKVGTEVRTPHLASNEVPDALIKTRIATMEKSLSRLQADGSSLNERLDSIEAAVQKLQRAIDGISLEDASKSRDALFRGENGYLKADEYFAAEKFAIAGEGYLAFLEEHGDHPEAFDILKRARQSFERAGYKDKAIWAQEELLTNLPERRPSDVMKLAQLEKDAGRYDDAISHAAEAAELATEPQTGLWNRLYWAWYNQLRDGSEAGLNAYRKVEQEIAEAGYSDQRLGDRVRAKIAEIERAQSVANQ